MDSKKIYKAELIEEVAQNAGISKRAASESVKAIVDAISEGLSKGERVSLQGFGTFKVVDRAPRTGRNPKTGAVIKIRAARRTQFVASKNLKQAIGGGNTGGGGPGRKR